jgi:ribosomal protein L11 methyltransferase
MARLWPALDIVTRGDEVDADLVDGMLAAFLDDYSATAIVDSPVPSRHPRLAWRVFFASAEARDRARRALASSEWHARVETAPVDVEDEGWAERSQATLTAVHVGRVIVAPPWDLPAWPASRTEPADVLVVIEPSMGFGTGHHQTTRLCLRALQTIDLTGRRVLDVGTGSGVLAIVAAKLGAASVLGIDDDPDAVDAAQKNVGLNETDAVVRIERSDLATAAAEPADLVLANLTGALLVRHAAAIGQLGAPGGLLVLSGFTEDERLAVAHAFRDMAVVGEAAEDGWISLTLRRLDPAAPRA